MKRIINGATYDTETATEVASGNHGHEASQAWWSLYRTGRGAFFEVVAGHDGIVEEFRPLTNGQAYTFLEVHANHLIVKYFGPVPEASPSRFSRNTIAMAIDIMATSNYFYQASITSFLNYLGPRVYKNIRGEEVSAAKRLNDLLRYVDENPGYLTDNGPLDDVIVEKAVSLMPSEPQNAWSSPIALSPQQEAFKRSLDEDGFAIAKGVLRRTLPTDVGLPQAQSELATLLEAHGLATSKGHLDQALDAHARGQWASANSQIRTFFESLTDDLAVQVDPSARALGSGHPRRTRLAMAGFFSPDLHEWDDQGKGFINGLVRRLNPQGSHPGLSDEDDSTFRLHIVLLTARLLLRRFDRGSRA